MKTGHKALNRSSGIGKDKTQGAGQTKSRALLCLHTGPACSTPSPESIWLTNLDSAVTRRSRVRTKKISLLLQILPVSGSRQRRRPASGFPVRAVCPDRTAGIPGICLWQCQIPACICFTRPGRPDHHPALRHSLRGAPRTSTVTLMPRRIFLSSGLQACQAAPFRYSQGTPNFLE